MTPTIKEGMPAREYHAAPGVHYTLLKHLRRSPAHAREYEQHPPDQTDAMRLGQAIHCAVLEPLRFATQYVVPPKVDRRTREGKATWAKYEASLPPEAEIVTLDEKILATSIYDETRDHAVAGPLLVSPKRLTEVSCFWTDQETGLDCKARLDLVSPWMDWTVLGDLKTTRDAGPDFDREVARYAYHVQAAFYLEALNQVSPRERRFFWIACEKDRPHAVGIHEPDEVCLSEGRMEVRRLLNLWAACKSKGFYPGYQTEPRPLALKKWAMVLGEDSNGL